MEIVMSKPYEAAARRCVRKAWLCLGKAREARSSAAFLQHDANWLRPILLGYVQDMVKCASGYSKQAVFYRQMNEVL
jgi:hypothetical protein